ncbi:hypothetical protein [Robertmurraya sp. FSL R5-0851]|uniref:hypothetical protein n=1 Tax=Robertmurraya sp. FSL R5-0851 TaxID=2921584 RepID=UPI0030FC65C1
MNIVPDCLICGENVDMEKDELGNWICTTCQQYTHWTRSEQGGYFSYHILITYLGNKEPKYHVLKNPDGDGWVIGVFYSFIGGEYVPLEEDGEEPLIFSTATDGMNYVDEELEGNNR